MIVSYPLDIEWWERVWFAVPEDFCLFCDTKINLSSANIYIIWRLATARKLSDIVFHLSTVNDYYKKSEWKP